MSVAVNALKKLKNQVAVADKGEHFCEPIYNRETVIKCQSYIFVIFKPFFSGADENEVNSPKSKGNIPLNLKFKGNGKNVFYYLIAFFKYFDSFSENLFFMQMIRHCMRA